MEGHRQSKEAKHHASTDTSRDLGGKSHREPALEPQKEHLHDQSDGQPEDGSLKSDSLGAGKAVSEELHDSGHKNRGDDEKQGQDCGEDHHRPDRPCRREQTAEDPAPLAARFEPLVRAELDGDSGEGLVKFIVVAGTRTHGRVVQVPAAGVVPLENEEVVEAPVDDERKRHVLELVRLPLHRAGLQSVCACRLDDVPCGRPVTSDSAPNPELLERAEEPVVRKDHAKARRPALGDLHLEDAGYAPPELSRMLRLRGCLRRACRRHQRVKICWRIDWLVSVMV